MLVQETVERVQLLHVQSMHVSGGVLGVDWLSQHNACNLTPLQLSSGLRGLALLMYTPQLVEINVSIAAVTSQLL